MYLKKGGSSKGKLYKINFLSIQFQSGKGKQVQEGTYPFFQIKKISSSLMIGTSGPIVVHTSTIADARHQEENPMCKKCLKAIVQEGHNICTSEWQMLSAIKYCIAPR